MKNERFASFFNINHHSLYFCNHWEQKKKQEPKDRVFYYWKDVITCIIFLLLFFILNPGIYKSLNFEKIGKGINISRDTLAAIMSVFLVPFILAFTPWNNFYPKDILSAKDIYGYPISLLPDNRSQLLLFNFYIIAGVVFEEMICRQFMFYSFNETLGLKGDILVISSSLLFAVGHFYQGWKGVIVTFLMGLVLGKIFLIKENILYPIGLHLISNLTISVLAYKRIKDIQPKF